MARPVDIAKGDHPLAGGERIAKLLARAGVASRREVERMIAEGRVARDGVTIDTPATVLPSLAGVTVDGNSVAAAEPARLFLYHKPPGLLVTERDPRGRPTIYDRLPKDLPRLVPVGRLDLNTEGLLLLTTDGGLKRQLELPATGVERTYRARAYGPVSQAMLEQLIDGIEIDGFRYGPIDANLERRTGANSWIELTLAEGKNREVRRVLEYLGLEVSRLIRTRYGPFVLGDLPAGAVGEVRQADLAAFRHTLGKATPMTRVPNQPITVAVAPAREPGPNRALASRNKPHPGAGRGPVATQSTQRPARVAPSRSVDPARNFNPRAGGGPVTMSPTKRPERASLKPARPSAERSNRAAVSAPQLDPGLRRGGDARRGGAKAAAPSAPTDTETPPTRPARIERKPGWARPKPKPGPKGKPRR